MKYSVNPPYKHLTQIKSLCWATSLQMILYRHGIWREQEQLAFDMGSLVRDENLMVYTLPFEHYPAWSRPLWFPYPMRGLDSTSELLSTLGFTHHIIPYDQINNLGTTLITHFEQNHDVMMCFMREWITHRDKTWWHYVLAEWYDSETDMIMIRDPSFNTPSTWQVPASEMMDAMSDRFEQYKKWLVIITKSD